MRAVVALVALALALVAAVSGQARTAGDGVPAAAGFQLADGSAGCAVLESGALACSANGPTVVLEPDGRSRAASDPVAWGAAAPVLAPAASWWHGGYSCRALGGGVACRSGDGQITVGAHRVGGVL